MGGESLRTQLKNGENVEFILNHLLENCENTREFNQTVKLSMNPLLEILVNGENSKLRLLVLKILLRLEVDTVLEFELNEIFTSVLQVIQFDAVDVLRTTAVDVLHKWVIEFQIPPNDTFEITLVGFCDYVLNQFKQLRIITNGLEHSFSVGIPGEGVADLSTQEALQKDTLQKDNLQKDTLQSTALNDSTALNETTGDFKDAPDDSALESTDSNESTYSNDTVVLESSGDTVVLESSNIVLPKAMNTVLPESSNIVLPESSNTVLPKGMNDTEKTTTGSTNSNTVHDTEKITTGSTFCDTGEADGCSSIGVKSAASGLENSRVMIDLTESDAEEVTGLSALVEAVGVTSWRDGAIDLTMEEGDSMRGGGECVEVDVTGSLEKREVSIVGNGSRGRNRGVMMEEEVVLKKRKGLDGVAVLGKGDQSYGVVSSEQKDDVVTESNVPHSSNRSTESNVPSSFNRSTELNVPSSFNRSIQSNAPIDGDPVMKDKNCAADLSDSCFENLLSSCIPIMLKLVSYQNRNEEYLMEKGLKVLIQNMFFTVPWQSVYVKRYTFLLKCFIRTLNCIVHWLEHYESRMKVYEHEIAKACMLMLMNCPSSCWDLRLEILQNMNSLMRSKLMNGFKPYLSAFADFDVAFGKPIAIMHVGNTRQQVYCQVYKVLDRFLHYCKIYACARKVLNLYGAAIHDHNASMQVQELALNGLFKFASRLIHCNIINCAMPLVQMILQKFKSLKNTIEKESNLSIEKVVHLLFQILKLANQGMVRIITVQHDVAALMHAQTYQFDTDIIVKTFKYGLSCVIEFGKTRKMQDSTIKSVALAFDSVGVNRMEQVFLLCLPLIVDAIAQNEKFDQLLKSFFMTERMRDTFIKVTCIYTSINFKCLQSNATQEKSQALLRTIKVVLACTKTIVQFKNATIEELAILAVSSIEGNCKHTHVLCLLHILFDTMNIDQGECRFRRFGQALPILVQQLIDLKNQSSNSVWKNQLLHLIISVPIYSTMTETLLPMCFSSMVEALWGIGELAKVALEVLECWIDKHGPSSLCREGNELHTKLINALCSHLHPPPYELGSTAMKILGKLGGHNRNYLKHPPNLLRRRQTKTGIAIELAWQDGTLPFSLPLDSAITRACDILTKLSIVSSAQKNHVEYLAHYKKQSFALVSQTLAGIITASAKNDVLHVARPSDEFVKADHLKHCSEVMQRAENFPSDLQAISNVEASQNVLFQLFSSLINMCGDADFGSEAQQLLYGYATHFAILVLSYSKRHEPNASFLNNSIKSQDSMSDDFEAILASQFGFSEVFNYTGVDIFTFSRALVEGLCSTSQSVLSAIYESLQVMASTCECLCESKQSAVKYGGPLFENLANLLVHACYSKSSSRKVAGCLGIRNLCQILHRDWALEHEDQLLHAMFFAIGDAAFENKLVHDIGKAAVELLLQTCHPNIHSTADDNLARITKLLYSQIVSPQTQTRILAMNAIELFASMNKTDIDNMVKPYEKWITMKIFQVQIRQLLPETITAFVDALAFGLKLGVHFAMTHKTLEFLDQAWELSSSLFSTEHVQTREIKHMANRTAYGTKSDDTSCYILFRISLCLCTKELFKRNPSILNGQSEIVMKFMTFLAQSMDEPHDNILAVAKSSIEELAACISKNSEGLYWNFASVFKVNFTISILRDNHVSKLLWLSSLPSDVITSNWWSTLSTYLQAQFSRAKILQTLKVRESTKPLVAIRMYTNLIQLLNIVPNAEYLVVPAITLFINAEVRFQTQVFKVPERVHYVELLMQYFTCHAVAFVQIMLSPNVFSSWSHIRVLLRVLKYKEADQLRSAVMSSRELSTVFSLVHFPTSDDSTNLTKDCSNPSSCKQVSCSTRKESNLIPNTFAASLDVTQKESILKSKAQLFSNSDNSRVRTSSSDASTYSAISSARGKDTNASKFSAIELDDQPQHEENITIKHAQGRSLNKSRVMRLKNDGNSLSNQANINDRSSLKGLYHGLRILKALHKVHRCILATRMDIVRNLLGIWRSKNWTRQISMAGIHPSYYRSFIVTFIKCMIACYFVQQDDMQILFDLLPTFSNGIGLRLQFLETFFTNELHTWSTPCTNKKIIKSCVAFIIRKDASVEVVLHALRVIMIPTIAHMFSNLEIVNSKVGDDEIIQTFMAHIICRKWCELQHEAIRISVLQLTALFLQHVPSKLAEYPAEIMQFIGRSLHHESPLGARWAYVCVCRFIAALETKSAVVVEVYVSLLVEYQRDEENLVRSALDMLTPVLKKRLSTSEYKVCLKWANRVMYEDGHSLGQLSHVLHLIVRHPETFYESRWRFVPRMVGSLHQLALRKTSTTEEQMLSLSIADLVITWEIKTRTIDLNDPTGMNATGKSCYGISHNPKQCNILACPENACRAEKFILNQDLINVVVNFLIRYALTCTSDREGTQLVSRATDLVKSTLALWPNVSIHFALFLKYCSISGSSNSESQSKMVLSPLRQALIMLNMVLETDYQQAAMKAFFSRLQTMLDPCFDTQDTEVQAQFSELILHFLHWNDATFNKSKVQDWIVNSLSKRLRQIKRLPYSMESLPVGGVCPKIIADCDSGHCVRKLIFDLIDLVADDFPDVFTKLLQPLLEAAEVLTFNHVHQALTNANNASSGSQSSMPFESKCSMASPSLYLYNTLLERSLAQAVHPEVVLDRISITMPCAEELKMCFELLFRAPTMENEDYNYLFTSLLQCIEHSNDIALLVNISTALKNWILEFGDIPTNARFTPEITCIVLSKMRTYDRFDEIYAAELFKVYRELVFGLAKLHWNTQKSTGNDLQNLPAHIGGPFVASIMSSDLKVRKRFLQLYNAYSPKSVSAKLVFALCQDWSCSGSKFWIIVLLEILLGATKNGRTGTIAPECKLFPPFRVVPQSGRPTISARAHLASHGRFLDRLKKSHSSQGILATLKDLLHIDVALAEEVWVSIFPKAWSTGLGEPEKETLTQHLVSLLAKPYHHRQLLVSSLKAENSNIVRSILFAISKCNPQPRIPVDLLIKLAKTYNAWCFVIPICEYNILSDTVSNQDRQNWIMCLSTLYRELSLDDLALGLEHRFSIHPWTRDALALEAHGKIADAQKAYYKLMNEHVQAGHVRKASKFETQLWEHRWVECAKHLGQWSILREFAKSTQDSRLLMNVLWKTSDFSYDEKIDLIDNMADMHVADIPENGLWEISKTVLQGKATSSDHMLIQTVHACLVHWNCLPQVLSVSHAPMLHFFHKLEEVVECADIFKTHQPPQVNSLAIANGTKGWLQFTKFSKYVWRSNRLLHSYESVAKWEDIFSWRTKVFSQWTSYSCPNNAMLLSQVTWNRTKLASVACKHGLHERSESLLALLGNSKNSNLNLNYGWLHSFVLNCYSQSDDLDVGLNLLNGADLNQFSTIQKAKIFRLKALILDSLGESNEANMAFSYSLSICDSYAKGWLSWGKYCDKLFIASNQLEYAIQAIACYLQGIHHGSNSSRLMLSRVLWLLTMDDVQGSLAHAFESHGKELPLWVWILWIPQLLSTLSRPQALQVRGLLHGIASKYPQALYYQLHSFLLEKRAIPKDEDKAGSPVSMENDAHKNARSSVVYVRSSSGHIIAIAANEVDSMLHEYPDLLGPPQDSIEQFGTGISTSMTLDDWLNAMKFKTKDVDKEVSSFQYSQEISSFLRRSHPYVVGEIDFFVEEVIRGFRIRPQDILYTALQTILEKCQQLKPSDMDRPITASFRRFFERISDKVFATNDTLLNWIAAYEDRFYYDFVLVNGEFTFGRVMEKIKQWQAMLFHQSSVVESCIHLEKKSRKLVEFCSRHIEIPGQYIFDKAPCGIIQLHHIDCTTKSVLRNGTFHKQFTLVGTNGQRFSFFVEVSNSHTSSRDELMMQMHILCNKLLDQHIDSASRNLALHIPLVVPLSPRVGLFGTTDAFTSLGKIYQEYCLETSQEVDHPIRTYYEKLFEFEERHQNNSTFDVASAKTQLYTSICDNHVSATVLSQHLHELFASPDHLFQFRHEFCKQLALSSFVQYIFIIGDRTPYKIEFSTQTGQVLRYLYPTNFCIAITNLYSSSEFRPGYNTSGLLEESESVPFRLTRNLHTFLTPFSVDGIFVNTMTAMSRCLESHESTFESQLSLYFRDDMTAWYISETQVISEKKIKELEELLEGCVDTNVDSVLSRTQAFKMSLNSPPLVFDLIAKATSSDKLSEMSPFWYPWL